MFTFSELRELVLAGEFVAVLRLLLAHRLVFTEDTQGDVTASLTSFSVQMMVTQPGCDRHITITLNSDGSPAVDVYPEQAPMSYLDDDFGVDPNTGKTYVPDGTDASLTETILDTLQEEGVRPISVTVSDYPGTYYIIRTNLGPVEFDFEDIRSARVIVEEFLENGPLSSAYQEYGLDLREDPGVDTESMDQEDIDKVCMSFRPR